VKIQNKFHNKIEKGLRDGYIDNKVVEWETPHWVSNLLNILSYGEVK